jgi:hypothetical protein
MDREKELSEIVKLLKDAAGENLRAVVLYGSGVDDDVREHSDLNILCLLQRLTCGALESIRPAALRWLRRGHPAPLVFALEELRNSADVFSIELLDMKTRHRMLEGSDFLASLEVPTAQHRLQVERELRTNVIRLRQSFLRCRGQRSELADLMMASASSFGTLFRHALIAVGQDAPKSNRAAADQLGRLLNMDAGAFHRVMDLREGKSGFREIDLEKVFAAYLDLVTKIAEEIDRRSAVS